MFLLCYCSLSLSEYEIEENLNYYNVSLYSSFILSSLRHLTPFFFFSLINSLCKFIIIIIIYEIVTQM